MTIRYQIDMNTIKKLMILKNQASGGGENIVSSGDR